mmetsp:Transcript_39303/g.76737  ORF Transcript_39303/g.76737 Transcript_39303/m.76737 type:complete len:228 (-) Transcript_39303:81-764(-)
MRTLAGPMPVSSGTVCTATRDETRSGSPHRSDSRRPCPDDARNSSTCRARADHAWSAVAAVRVVGPAALACGETFATPYEEYDPGVEPPPPTLFLRKQLISCPPVDVATDGATLISSRRGFAVTASSGANITLFVGGGGVAGRALTAAGGGREPDPLKRAEKADAFDEPTRARGMVDRVSREWVSLRTVWVDGKVWREPWRVWSRSRRRLEGWCCRWCPVDSGLFPT